MARDGDALETHYRHLLEELGKKKGMLGVIFHKAQNKIQDPAKLRRLIVDPILRGDPGTRFNLVLTNPPFGKKSSVLVINEEGDQEREALTVSCPPKLKDYPKNKRSVYPSFSHVIHRSDDVFPF
jgi:hypothetical protein